MSDSIDRVFAHALQTVRKIPYANSSHNNVPGSPSINAGGSSTTATTATNYARRPPAEDRLRLYGLYKQSMEGDVVGIMERPTSGKLEADKWDAWNAVRGMKKTEAKRRYIEYLIETMKKYASDTPEAKALVAELEFVWDQVKFNSNTHSANQSNASNNYNPSKLPPAQTQMYAEPPPRPGQQEQQQLQFPEIAHSRPVSPANEPLSLYRQEPSRPPDFDQDYTGYQSSGDREHLINPGRPYYEQPLRRMKVGSHGTRSMRSGDDDDKSGYDDVQGLAEEDAEEELDSEDELFEDPTQLEHDDEEEEEEEGGHLILGRDTSPDVGTMRWQLRVERALSKMSAEITALREQLEVRNTHMLQSSSSWFWTPLHSETTAGRNSQSGVTTGSREVVGGVSKRFGKAVWQVVWTVLRHLMVDAVVVGIVVWWMGKRGDRRAGEVLKWLTRVIGKRRGRRGEKGIGGEGS